MALWSSLNEAVMQMTGSERMVQRCVTQWDSECSAVLADACWLVVDERSECNAFIHCC